MELICDECDRPKELIDALFPKNTSNPLTLEEAAQVVEIELKRRGESIHRKASEVIDKLDATHAPKQTKKFFADHKIKIVTTNYDKLAEELAGMDRCH